MTRILDLPTLGWDFTVRNNEDWVDSSYQYLDATGALIPFDGIDVEVMVRRSAGDRGVVLSASTSGRIDGVATSGLVLTAPGVWGLSVPLATMLQVLPGLYPWEARARAERSEVIGFGTVTVIQGIVR